MLLTANLRLKHDNFKMLVMVHTTFWRSGLIEIFTSSCWWVFTDLALSSTFFDDLPAVFEVLTMHRFPVIVCGDFNILVDRADDVNAVHLRDLVQWLRAACRRPTHKHGHTLDLVLFRSEVYVQDLRQLRVGGIISDHAFIDVILGVKKPQSEALWVTSTSWRFFSVDAFASDLSSSKLCSSQNELDVMASTTSSISTDCRDVLTSLWTSNAQL